MVMRLQRILWRSAIFLIVFITVFFLTGLAAWLPEEGFDLSRELVMIFRLLLASCSVLCAFICHRAAGNAAKGTDWRQRRQHLARRVAVVLAAILLFLFAAVMHVHTSRDQYTQYLLNDCRLERSLALPGNLTSPCRIPSFYAWWKLGLDVLVIFLRVFRPALDPLFFTPNAVGGVLSIDNDSVLTLDCSLAWQPFWKGACAETGSIVVHGDHVPSNGDASELDHISVKEGDGYNQDPRYWTTRSLSRVLYTGPVVLAADTQMVQGFCCGTEEVIVKIPRSVSRHRRGMSSVPNILFLLIDSLSTLRYMEMMPATRNALESATGASSFLFSRYTSIGSHTSSNVPAMLSGNTPSAFAGFKHHKGWRKRYFWEDLAAAHRYDTMFLPGYCADFAENGLWKSNATMRTDFEPTKVYCHPDFYDARNPYGNWRGPYSVYERRVAGKHVHKYSLDYLKQFIDSRRSSPWISVVNFIEGHEGSGSVIETLDDDLAEFIGDLSRSGELSRTVVVLVADHGNVGGLKSLFKAAFIDLYRPVLHLLVPNSLFEVVNNSRAVLEANTRRLVSHYDLYRTLVEITGAISYVKRKLKTNTSPLNLLRTEVDPSRSCEKAGLGSNACDRPKLYSEREVEDDEIF